MRFFINKNKVIEAFISEPYISTGEAWDSNSHGWRVNITLGYRSDGSAIGKDIDFESKRECLLFIEKLDLINYK